jgi:uncharacterized repeat protein (TIGR01451 family)
MRRYLASLLVFILGFHAQAQTLTPAGTPIRNQASASFIGPNGEPGVTFSGVAQTLVSPVYGLQIKPDANNAPSTSGSNFSLGPDAGNDRIVIPGGTISFSYTLTNTGNAADRFTVSAVQFAGDGFDLSNLRIVIDSNENGLIDNGEPDLTGSIDLNANAHTGIIVSGLAPTTNNGAKAKLDLISSSLNDPNLIENNNIARATINSDANLILNKEARLLTDGRIRYRVFGSNQGARAARSSLSGVIVDGTLYFGILMSDPLPTDSVLDLLETPSGSAGGASSARVIYKVSFGTWTATPTTTASSIALFIPDQNPTTGSPVTDTLNISGGYELNFHVRAKPGLRAGSIIANTATIQYRDGSNTERETVSNTTLSGVPTQFGAMIGAQSQPTGLASGSYTFTDPSTNKTWTVNRSRNGNDQTDQQNIESSNGSNVISFINTVQNTGNARDTLNVRFDPNDVSSILPAGSNVQVYTADGTTPINNGIILEPNETGDVIVRVTLPASTGPNTNPNANPNGPNLSAVIRVTSSSDPSKTDITRDTIGTLPSPDVLIGPLGAANASEYPNAADRQTLEPFEGASARFPQTVRNNGNISDVMNLSLETPLPPGFNARWLTADGTALTDSNNDGQVDTGLRAAASEVNVIFEITPPNGTSGNNGGAGWSFVVKVTSSADRSNSNRSLDLISRLRTASEIWTLTKSVSSNAGPKAQALAPEAKLIYSLTVANIGSLPQQDVRISDTLSEWLEAPTQISNISVTDSNGTGVALNASYDPQTRRLEWFIPNFPANTSLALTFHTAVPKGTPDATIIPNTALVSSRDVPRAHASNRVDVNVISPVLKLNKVALEGSVSIGGVVQFELEARNNSNDATLTSLTITDFMPVGLIYRAGSSRLNNQAIPDPEVISENGMQTLRWKIGDLPANSSQKIRFAATATPAFPGEVVNQATAKAIAANGAIIIESNKARASVKRANGIFSASSTVLGRVYFDTDGNKRFDAGRDEVLPNARIYLSNGRYAITDNQGLYSFPDLESGRYAMRLDPLTVPFIAARVPDDQCAPGTRPLMLEGNGIVTKDFLLLPPSAAASKVRSTVLQLGGIKLEKHLRQGGAGYAVEMTLTLDRGVANLTLSDPLPNGSIGPQPSDKSLSSPNSSSSLSVRGELTLERLDANGDVIERISLNSGQGLESGAEIRLGMLTAGTYRLRYALLTDLEPDQAVTDPDLVWNELPK